MITNSILRIALVTAVASISTSTLSSSGNAQEVTGSISGRVVASGGAPAGGALIVAASADLAGTRQVVADRDGHFVILSLPPAKYVLRIRNRTGESTVLREVVVRVGETSIMDRIVVDRPTSLPTIVVAAPQINIDPYHSDVSAFITPADYSRLPGGREYTSLLSALPHVNESYRGDPINVGGATGLENVYFIDGLNVTAPLHAERGTALPYNFVRAVEMKVGGYGAQYGEALGGIVNAITYAGSNDFEVAGFMSGTGGGLRASPKAEPTLRETSAIDYDMGLRISGALIRDALWYSIGYDRHVRNLDKEINGLGLFSDNTSAHLFAGKLTWSRRAFVTEFSIFGDPTTSRGVSVPDGLASGIVPLNADPYLVRVRTGGTAGVMRSAFQPYSGLLIEAVIGTSVNSDSRDGATPKGRSEPLFVDEMDGKLSGGFGRYDVSDARRTTSSLRITRNWRLDELITGVGYQDIGVSRIDAQSGDRIYSRDLEGKYSAGVENFGGPRVRNRVPAAYVQNSWRPYDRVTVNTGLRWSRQTLVGASGNVAVRFANEWQPRGGVIVRLGEKGQRVLSASAGRFYQTLPLNLSSLTYVSGVFGIEYYREDPRTPGVIPSDRQMFDATEQSAVDVTNVRRAEHHDEVTLSYQQPLTQTLKASIRLLHKELRSSFQWGFNGYDLVIGTPGEGAFDFLPRAKRKYTAIELTADGTWSHGGYRTSYIHSTSRGNYTGFYEPDFGYTNPGGNAGFLAPHQAVNSYGDLPNSIPHMLKASLWSEAGRNATLGGVISWRSGFPINEFAPSPVKGLELQRAFVRPRGSVGRTPSLFDLNLRGTYDARFINLPHARLLLDILHVGNPQRVVKVDELHFQSNVDGIYSNPNPNYLKSVAFQPPMEARIGIEIGSRNH